MPCYSLAKRWEAVLVKFCYRDIECFPRLLRIGLRIIVVLLCLLRVWGWGITILLLIARGIIWCSLGIIAVVVVGWISKYLRSPLKSKCVFVFPRPADATEEYLVCKFMVPIVPVPEGSLCIS